MARPALRQQTAAETILSAARVAFGQYGFNGTTTAAIAQRAGVSEPLVYRHFGTKDALFDAAVLTPFTDLLTRLLTEWQGRRPGTLPTVEEAENLFNDLIRLFLEEREVILPLLAVYHFGNPGGSLKSRLEYAMREVVAIVEHRAAGEAAIRGYTGVDIPALARIMVGVCFSVVTFPRLFDMDHLPRTRFVREMARLTMHGVEFRTLPLREDLDPHSMSAATGRVDAASTPRRRGVVTDAVWARIEAVLLVAHPPSRRGRRPIDDRLALEGVIDTLLARRPWRELPRPDMASRASPAGAGSPNGSTAAPGLRSSRSCAEPKSRCRRRHRPPRGVGHPLPVNVR